MDKGTLTAANLQVGFKRFIRHGNSQRNTRYEVTIHRIYKSLGEAIVQYSFGKIDKVKISDLTLT